MTSAAPEHPSGALKMPGTPDFPELHIWFSDCRGCRRGTVFKEYHWNAPGGQWQQCAHCYSRYFQWLKAYHLIRYVVFRSNYPIKLCIDHSKDLVKSGGRIFYHERDYTAEDKGVRVEAYALDADGKRQEQLRIEGALCKVFPTLAAAQMWICQQMGGSLRTFWFS